jgi:DNA-nicking Smr family endonuclease
MGRKKKNIQKVDGLDLYQAFGVEEKTLSFAEELAGNLAEQDLEKVIREKSEPFDKPPTRQDKLKSYPPPQDTLDLHGLTGPEAAKKTVDFLRTANTLKLRTFRIITGKGLHSEGPAVLPDVVEEKLEEFKAADLLFDFQWDRKKKHKSGSVIVYMK